MTELVVLLDNREVGTLHQDRGRTRFEYTDEWRTAPGAYPLSLSMPMAAREHGPAVVESFLWGLLPDNASTLARWAQDEGRFSLADEARTMNKAGIKHPVIAQMINALSERTRKFIR
jgi:HipA-like protein